MLNKQSGISDRELSTSLGLVEVLTNPVVVDINILFCILDKGSSSCFNKS